MTDASQAIHDRWNSLPTVLNHHTITSSGIDKSPRSEVTPDAFLEDHLQGLLSGPTKIPGFEAFSSSGQASEEGLRVDVTYKGALIVSFIVCPANNDASKALFDELKKDDMVHPQSREPQAPYCSASLGFAALGHSTALGWLADYERRIAWTWLSMTVRGN